MTPPDQPDLDDFLEKGLSAAFSAEEGSASGGIAAAMVPDRETPIPTGVGRYPVDEVEFPSGAVLSFGEGVDSNLCLECHQDIRDRAYLNYDPERPCPVYVEP